MVEQTIKLQRAEQALLGLRVGDAFGSYFEMWRVWVNRRYISKRSMPDEIWKYTDDTEMALSIYAVLRQFGKIDQDDLIIKFLEHYTDSRRYGNGAIILLKRIAKGEDWRLASKDMFRGEGSFGNGGAMRVAPLGAYFADDFDALIQNARLSAEVTHAHPEGIAGAIAVAIAVAVIINLPAQEKPSQLEFFNLILPHIPDSEVRENCLAASKMSLNLSTDEASKISGNGRHVSAMDTVPISLWVALKYLDSFEEAMWQLASIGGDVDTTCAIAGSIIASYSGESIPKTWIDTSEAIPDWVLKQ